jgi:hypothetical protein
MSSARIFSANAAVALRREDSRSIFFFSSACVVFARLERPQVLGHLTVRHFFACAPELVGADQVDAELQAGTVIALGLRIADGGGWGLATWLWRLRFASDEYTKQCLAIEVGRSIRAVDAISVASAGPIGHGSSPSSPCVTLPKNSRCVLSEKSMPSLSATGLSLMSMGEKPTGRARFGRTVEARTFCIRLALS